MKIREIMTTDVRTASPETNLDEIAKIMREEDVGAIPVVENGELRGIITDRDIVVRCIAEGNDPGEVTVEEILSEQIETVAPDEDVEDAAQLMAERQIRRLPVVEDGGLVGMISIGDVAVKQEDKQVSGKALREVSKGVKGGRKATAKGKAAKGKGAQGISSAAREREEKRQSRVVPFRQEARAPRRRRAS